MGESDNHSIYEGLLALLENEFPKTCPNCDRTYRTLEEFVDRTKSVQQGTGLMGYDTGHPFQQVVMARNCLCGSTMATFCCDRRDYSEAGTRRRRLFENLLERLKTSGIDPLTARNELLSFLHGERSQLLESLGFAIRPPSLQPHS